MASWKALGWILEAPELDFRASRPRFWSLQPRFWSLQARLWSLQASNLPLLMLPTFSNTTWQTWDSLLPGVHSFCVFAFLNSLAKVWEAAVSPLGGLQSAAHRRCAGRARPQPHRSQPKLQIYHKWLSSWWQAQVLRSRLLDPSLFLSPGAWGPPPTLRQEAEKWDFVAFFFDFLPIQVAI